ncbi:oxygenase MpaB family protein [Antrihabitans cavernicola]|uniref:DUF2236 domain-containing protein n=1 Tax=Antrihabitans cavernicola TaxID=2495913 RepID=A0A5A7S5G9_9NOCA|nr:oxygenase MpaB family protein [Spelaeibacter cavernicola]KAA0016769.1 DUF2236 domain-containing protein [Spelaeibacter cavernicola]
MRGLASRRWARDSIAALDPVADNERITHLSAEVRYGDPMLTAALYTVAFCRQMAVPSIAKVVHRGGRGPIMRDTRKRNDDTMVFFGEFMRSGYSSDRGRAAIERLNRIHAPFPITNDQSLYTLASLAFEADRIPARFGVKLLSRNEMEANYRFWCGVGTAMGLHDIPPTYDEFSAWAREYERANWAYSPGGSAVARTMIDDYAARWLPSRLRFLARTFVATLCDDELLDTLELRKPSRSARACTGIALRAYTIGRRALPTRPIGRGAIITVRCTGVARTSPTSGTAGALSNLL